MFKGKPDVSRLKAAQEKIKSLCGSIYAPWSRWCTCGEGHDIPPDEIEWTAVGNTIVGVHAVCGKYWWTPPGIYQVTEKPVRSFSKPGR